MANIKSAQKRVRQNKVRTVKNRNQKTRIKNARKLADAAIASGDSAQASTAVRALFSAADRAAKNGVIHKNSASRLRSIYMQRIGQL